MATDPISTKSGRRPTGRGVVALLLAGLFWLLKRAFRRTREVIHAGIQAPPPPVPPDVNPRSVASGHEVSDVSVGKIFFFGVALSVSVLAVLVVALLYFRLLGRWERRSDANRPRREPAAASLVVAGHDGFAGPLLQVRPEEELQALRDGDGRELDSYGWLDRPAGVVRLPIERAMDLLAERGLPPVSPGKTAVQIQQERALPENCRDDLRQPTFAPSAP